MARPVASHKEGAEQKWAIKNEKGKNRYFILNFVAGGGSICEQNEKNCLILPVCMLRFVNRDTFSLLLEFFHAHCPITDFRLFCEN